MKIVHISDLHFGAEYPDRVALLREQIREEKADLIIASGDLTQAGHKSEFMDARAFLDALETPWIAVPGNHDMPVHNLYRRFTQPFRRYSEVISPELDQIIQTDDVCIVAVNSARPAVPHWNWAHGAVSGRQIRFIEDAFHQAARGAHKVLVIHHPLFRLPASPMKTIVWGSSGLTRLIAEHPGMLILTGHTHAGALCRLENGTLLVAAPSAISHRLRGQENGYNLLLTRRDELYIRQITYDKDNARFRPQSKLDIQTD